MNLTIEKRFIIMSGNVEHSGVMKTLSKAWNEMKKIQRYDSELSIEVVFMVIDEFGEPFDYEWFKEESDALKHFHKIRIRNLFNGGSI